MGRTLTECESEDERQELIRKYSENEGRSEAEARKLYNPDNLFKKDNMALEEKNEGMQIAKSNGNIFEKIWTKIKLLLNKN